MRPLGRSAAPTRPGRSRQGRASSRTTRRGDAGPNQSQLGVPLSRPEITRRRAMVSGLAGAVRRWASVSSTWTPPRRMAPKLDPAEVPMITSAVRGSHPVALLRAESAPEW